MEIYLHREELLQIIEFIDKVNPDKTLKPHSGKVKITYDASSGIGAIITATCRQEYLPGQFGDLTISISEVENW